MWALQIRQSPKRNFQTASICEITGREPRQFTNVVFKEITDARQELRKFNLEHPTLLNPSTQQSLTISTAVNNETIWIRFCGNLLVCLTLFPRIQRHRSETGAQPCNLIGTASSQMFSGNIGQIDYLPEEPGYKSWDASFSTPFNLSMATALI